MQLVFDMGTPNPPDTWIRIQMPNSVSVDKSVSVSMVSVPTATGLDHLFSSKILKFLLIFVFFCNFFQFYLHCILYNY